MLVIKCQFNQKCYQHQQVARNRKFENCVKNLRELFNSLNRWLDNLSKDEGHDEAVNCLENFVREHSLEQFIVVKSQHVLVNYEINHVYEKILAEVKDNKDSNSQVNLFVINGSECNECEDCKAIKPRKV